MGFKSTKPFFSNKNKVNADTFAICMDEIQKILQNNIHLIQDNQEYYAN